MADFQFTDYPNLASRFFQARDEQAKIRNAVSSGADVVVLRPEGVASPLSLPLTKVKHVDVNYPVAFRRAGIQAEVGLYYLVDEKGALRTPVFFR